ncbi:MAG: hypothetical protein IPH82_14535 [Chloroflexi bacterium]|nr:hypothetical protein [Chloroflexota bacterium]
MQDKRSACCQQASEELMPTLHVRNVPEALYDRLRERAQERNRSLSAEVLILLDFALDESEDSQTELLDSIRRRRFFNPAAVGAPDSSSMLREDRAR